MFCCRCFNRSAIQVHGWWFKSWHLFQFAMHLPPSPPSSGTGNCGTCVVCTQSTCWWHTHSCDKLTCHLHISLSLSLSLSLHPLFTPFVSLSSYVLSTLMLFQTFSVISFFLSSLSHFKMGLLVLVSGPTLYWDTHDFPEGIRKKEREREREREREGDVGMNWHLHKCL